ncbi:MAG: hypothetical protein IPJ51_07610 [Saprospiraceae bacterium]|nr:hypothetical protein [Saprospiraceae bacterium]
MKAANGISTSKYTVLGEPISSTQKKGFSPAPVPHVPAAGSCGKVKVTSSMLISEQSS